MKRFLKIIEIFREKLFFMTPILFFFPSLYLHFSNVEPVQRGFFCDDKSLNYPFEENETISSPVCLIIWLSISVFILLFKRRFILKEFSSSGIGSSTSPFVGRSVFHKNVKKCQKCQKISNMSKNVTNVIKCKNM